MEFIRPLGYILRSEGILNLEKKLRNGGTFRHLAFYIIRYIFSGGMNQDSQKTYTTYMFSVNLDSFRLKIHRY